MNLKKIITTTTLAVSFFAFSALAQAPNKQPTTAEETNRFGKPLPAAVVTLEQEAGSLRKTLRTDAQGQFEFSDLQPGRYRLKVEHTIVSPRDHATGQAAGKQAAGATVGPPRDHATGQASGQRQTAAGTENNGTGTNPDAAQRTINTSRSNIKNQRVAAEIVVDDAETTPPATKTGVSTSRSNVRNKNSEAVELTTEEVLAIQLFKEEAPVAKRAFVVPHILEKPGLLVEVGRSGRVIGNVLKTRHDTVKNAIGNIR